MEWLEEEPGKRVTIEEIKESICFLLQLMFCFLMACLVKIHLFAVEGFEHKFLMLTYHVYNEPEDVFRTLDLCKHNNLSDCSIIPTVALEFYTELIRSRV